MTAPFNFTFLEFKYSSLHGSAADFFLSFSCSLLRKSKGISGGTESVGERTTGTAAFTAVVALRTQVVKHADEAANDYQIFIRRGEAVQLVKENEAEGAGAVTSYSLLSLSL